MMTKLLFIISLAFLYACAGPTTPFGAINKPLNKTVYSQGLYAFEQAKDMFLEFYPSRQYLHGSKSLNISIHSNIEKITPSAFTVYYNQNNITSIFMSTAQVTLAKDFKQINFSINDLILLPGKTNQLLITYISPQTKKKYAWQYKLPKCSINSLAQNFRIPASYGKTKQIKKHINIYSSKYMINNALVAGLIAQESAFNPLAISSAKAIGLTQITSLAEQDLKIKWPKYPGLNGLSVAKMKSLVMLGVVHDQNEWRLSPEKSIQGGIKFLYQIKDYWNKPNNTYLLEKSVSKYDELKTDVLLASYNSGPYRVKKEISKYGNTWLSSPNLKEANKYVQKVKSYCYHFSNTRD